MIFHNWIYYGEMKNRQGEHITSRLRPTIISDTTALRVDANGYTMSDGIITRVFSLSGGITVYALGKEYVFQSPGDVTLGEIRITKIELADIRDYTDEDAQKEGYRDLRDLLSNWVARYDNFSGSSRLFNFSNYATILKSRPNHYYEVYKISYQFIPGE